jgi:hypothetical protein
MQRISTTMTVCIPVEVSGSICAAEPDVGIPREFAEDILISLGEQVLPEKAIQAIEAAIGDEAIQDALVEAYGECAHPDPDRAYDEMRDQRGEIG